MYLDLKPLKNELVKYCVYSVFQRISLFLIFSVFSLLLCKIILYDIIMTSSYSSVILTLQVVRDSTPNQYMVLLKFKDKVKNFGF